jgi:hypothetical protein
VTTVAHVMMVMDDLCAANAAAIEPAWNLCRLPHQAGRGQILQGGENG